MKGEIRAADKKIETGCHHRRPVSRVLMGTALSGVLIELIVARYAFMFLEILFVVMRRVKKQDGIEEDAVRPCTLLIVFSIE